MASIIIDNLLFMNVSIIFFIIPNSIPEKSLIKG